MPKDDKWTKALGPKIMTDIEASDPRRLWNEVRESEADPYYGRFQMALQIVAQADEDRYRAIAELRGLRQVAVGEGVAIVLLLAAALAAWGWR